MGAASRCSRRGDEVVKCHLIIAAHGRCPGKSRFRKGKR